ncbi:uncharacterized protein LOC103959681 isoform X3 [Pyrus x bretschneideri]|uniref:uncharacterized protein LOC103959681 isoform X3 n=1 Tax=Pyrus x bretschneideri TaxID=225117 RepID=UPI0020304475|nr:uncharacterized protein LOC103959681 isoform X3 [Pyrus x bretschneideri]XP_048423874.1 uncharacterized protein LOC103959681 isoform X3 [Pyrus x bretschneideri]XP_048423876.1 uncharacterized protein LOC103959681 isoform X3 [Pyrus x bretschneideri]XP_048423878.1 uncharacterized protein LOC103959681 isoform X3 [Pyrus x bretschneideri]XP_048423880.1 uncharacterized protein LOC103959681 isoform X3 [Pyrus x bretschneideri]XP_048423884.1 uncharacterized protein LOC103959681 isoform X3 [Pyrus x bre
MTKSSFMQAHEFEKRRAESHSGIQPSVPLMISHTLSLISEQYEAARALCALNQWQSSRGGTRNSCKSKVEEKLDERRKDNVFIISNFKSKYPVLQLDLILISDLVVVIVSATCGGIAFACSGQPI